MTDRRIWTVAVFIALIRLSYGLIPALGASRNDGSSTPKNILFIGNSYTDQIKETLLRMVEGSPYKQTRIEFIVKGGFTLEQHINDKETLRRIKAGNWDIVVLQDQSQTPALPGKYGKSFQVSVDKFTELIRSAGAAPLLFMTWGRRDGDKQNKALFPDYATMQQKLSDAYLDAAKRNKLSVAPVGQAWAMVRKKDEELGTGLYKMDGSHPSPKGATLASYVFFRVLFDGPLDAVQAGDILKQHELETIKSVVRRIDIPRNKPDNGAAEK